MQRTQSLEMARVASLVLAAGILSASGPADASAPSNTGERVILNVDHHCVSDPRVLCMETEPINDPPFVAFTGSECPAPEPVRWRPRRYSRSSRHWAPAPPPPSNGGPCAVSFLEGAKLSGTVTLLADEAPFDNTTPPPGLVVTAVMDLYGKGRKIKLVEIYTGDASGSVEIGGWNPIFEEAEIVSGVEALEMIPVKSQLPLQERLREIAQELFGCDGVPIITEWQPVWSPWNVDEASFPGPGSDLASSAVYRVVIRFARGTNPTE